MKKACDAVRLSLAGLVLLGCAERVQQEVSPTPITPTPVTREFTPIPVRAFPSPTSPAATPPVSGAPRPSENRAARFDGRGDGFEVQSEGILLTGPFRIEAKIKVEGNVGGDTVVSKGVGFAVFARSLRCSDKLGLLVDGQDICSGARLGLGTFNDLIVAYDGREIIVTVNGQNILSKQWQGPLQISTQDLTVGRRPGGLEQPFTGLVDDFKVYEDGKLKALINFDQGFVDLSPQKRKVTILGDPKLEVVR